MKTVYIIDYLGVHCGMHYYTGAFEDVLRDAGWREVRTLSNHGIEGKKPFFLNQYKGSIVHKGTSLLRNLGRLRRFIKTHSDDIYIYLTYGNPIDMHFMRMVAKARHHIIDIHEAVAQAADSNESLKDKFRQVYSEQIKSVISHSGRTDDFLRQYGYKGQTLRVPHFKYNFSKTYNTANIPADVIEAPQSDKINVLFFGNINANKGIDILLEAYNSLSPEEADRLNIMVSGKDNDGVCRKVEIKPDRNVRFFLRHINDDELCYLYQSADYLALPYRKTSQSGILEMAFYFKKPILASDVPYFRTTLDEFPSFGLLGGNSVDDYANLLRRVIDEKDSMKFFVDSDYDRYTHRQEVEDFKRSFNEWALKNP